MSGSKFTTTTTFKVMMHVIAWIIVFAVPVILRAASDEGVDMKYFQRPTYWSYHFSIIAVFYFNAFFLVPKVLYRKGTGLYILSALGVIIAASFVIMIFFILFGQNRLRPEEHPHNPVWILAGAFFPSLLVCAVSTSYRIIRDRNVSEKLLKDRENEHLKSELTFLRSQVSPHFMFNVLNNIVSLSRKRSDMVEPVVIKLSQLLRYMLYESDEDKVQLSKEMEYLQSYIDLQMLRFGDDVKLSSDIQKVIPSAFIEPMLLIPFVENAFKHGVVMISKPEIELRFNATDTELKFSVRNKFNDKAVEEKDKNSGIGLNNVERRLNLLYKNRHELKVNKNAGWFSVELSLKLK